MRARYAPTARNVTVRNKLCLLRTVTPRFFWIHAIYQPLLSGPCPHRDLAYDERISFRDAQLG